MNSVKTPFDQPVKSFGHLEFLDGMRGIAALYVVIFHLYTYSALQIPNFVQRMPTVLTDGFQIFFNVLSGRSAVDVFIVLSGYCLMLPVAQSHDRQLRGGTLHYLRRRARRILPPYYAALALGIGIPVLIRLWGFLHHTTHVGLMPSIIFFTKANLIAHLFLVQNLRLDWMYAFDVPLWSVATEWQIYFLLPFVFLPVWRKYGNVALILVGFAIGLLPHFLLPPSHNLDEAAPWFAGLFAMGMAGAVITARPQEGYRHWGAVGAFLFGLYIVLNGLNVPEIQTALWHFGWIWVRDAVLGAAAVCCILFCSRNISAPIGPAPLAVRLLASKPAVALGAFSYSLYLVHIFVLYVVSPAYLARHFAVPLALLLEMVFGLLLAVGFAYLFHICIERRFMTGRPRTERQAEISALVSPAP